MRANEQGQPSGSGKLLDPMTVRMNRRDAEFAEQRRKGAGGKGSVTARRAGRVEVIRVRGACESAVAAALCRRSP